MKIMLWTTFFYGDLEGLGYICVSAWKKYILGIPWRHSNCWLPNSFILGGGGGIQSSEMLVKCNFPVLPQKKTYKHLSNQWQLQAFQLAAHLGDKTKVFINDGDPLLKPHSKCLFNTISGWVCPPFPEAYLPQICVQNRNLCTRNSLLSRLSNGESE